MLQWHGNKREAFWNDRSLANIANMSSWRKIIDVRELEADLLAESPSSTDADWVSDTSSDLIELGKRITGTIVENKREQSCTSPMITVLENNIPSPLTEFGMDTMEAVLGDISPRSDEEIVRIQWNPLTGVSCPPSTGRTPIMYRVLSRLPRVKGRMTRRQLWRRQWNSSGHPRKRSGGSWLSRRRIDGDKDVREVRQPIPDQQGIDTWKTGCLTEGKRRRPESTWIAFSPRAKWLLNNSMRL